MGEYVHATIRIGGTLPRSRVAEFCEIISGQLLNNDIDDSVFEADNELGLIAALDEKGVLSLHGEANYGLMPSITEKCHELGLTYVMYSAAGYEWGPTVYFWSPDYDDEQEHETTVDGERVVAYSQIMEIKKCLEPRPSSEVFEVAHTRIAKAVKMIDRLFPTIHEVPKLEVTDA